MVNEVCVIGGGAVGGVIAYYLYRSGVRFIPVYYSSLESIREIEENHGLLVIDKPRGQEVLVPITPRSASNPIDKCHFVFNAVKAYHVDESLLLARKILDPGGVLLMLQNGFGSLEKAEEFIIHGKVAAGVVYYGAERVSRSRILYHGGGVVIAGSRKTPCPELFELATLFRIGGLDFRLTNNIDFYRWLKLALNAVVNSITAITMARNKIVLEPEAQWIAKMIVREVVEAARVHGYEFSEERLLEYINRNVEAVAENSSSMLQDLTRGSITEVDYINGYVVRTLGERAVVNTVITLLVKLIEKTRREKALLALS